MSQHAKKHYGAEAIVIPSRLRRSPEMNVTPLIDVLLVLLVIFLAALPMTQKGTDVEIPPQAATPSREGQMVVELTADHQLALNQRPVRLGELTPMLRDLYRDRRDKTIFLIGAGTLPYGEVVAVIDAAKAAGLERVGIVTEGMRARHGRGTPGAL